MRPVPREANGTSAVPRRRQCDGRPKPSATRVRPKDKHSPTHPNPNHPRFKMESAAELVSQFHPSGLPLGPRDGKQGGPDVVKGGLARKDVIVCDEPEAL